jgi:TPR repeat protein
MKIRRLAVAGVFFGLIILALPTRAEEADSVFDDAIAAYWRGEYGVAWFGFWSLAQRGNAPAQFNLSRLYQLGQGVERDPAQARHWTEAAARQSYPPAMFTLGQHHQLGVGGAVDLNEARRWYRASAEAGYGMAQYNLALMYEIGYGGERDLTVARHWYMRAAEQKVDRARDALMRLGPELPGR